MSYETGPSHYQRQASVAPVAFFTALLTSLLVTLGVLAVTGNLGLFNTEDSSSANSLPKVQKVPAVVGLTPEVAGDVVRARDFSLLIGGEVPDAKIEKGKIAAQEPLANSDLAPGKSVKVLVSTGPKQTAVPAVVGKPLEEAKQLLIAKGLAVGEVSETGEGAPGTVVDADPKPGTEVEEGRPISLIASPSGVPVPDVVGMYQGKAQKTLEDAGFKKGTVRWRYNDYKDENVVLAQEPAAGTTAAPGSAIDLVVNSEE